MCIDCHAHVYNRHSSSWYHRIGRDRLRSNKSNRKHWRQRFRERTRPMISCVHIRVCLPNRGSSFYARRTCGCMHELRYRVCLRDNDGAIRLLVATTYAFVSISGSNLRSDTCITSTGSLALVRSYPLKIQLPRVRLSRCEASGAPLLFQQCMAFQRLLARTGINEK